MRNVAAISCAATLISSAVALSVRKPADTAAPKVIQHTIKRRDVPNPLARDRRLRMSKRSNTILESLTNDETLYYANCTIGTPAQTFNLHIDTGSSDMWVNVASSEICTYENEDLCAASGTYSANDSSTYTYVNSEFSISYADDSGASGDYATDVFNIGGATIDAQQFGIGYVSTTQQGILGIGYASNEASISTYGQEYANVPLKMVQSGLINAAAYSLWLNDLDASTGSILFGGVDTDKYSGSLSTLPIIQTEGEYTAFYIALTAVGMNGDDDSLASGLDTAVLLDSGTTLTYLPNNVTALIYDKLDLTYDESEGAAFIDCDRASDNYTVDYTFSSPVISVSMSELVLPIGTQNGKEVCVFGIAPADGTTCVLGDTFLRSAYVVYDLSDNKIAIAQTKFNITTSSIEEITNATTTSSGIPDSSTVADAVSAASDSTSTASVNSGSSGSGSGSGGTTTKSLSAAATMGPSRVVQGLGAVGLLAAGALMVV